jgi:RNA polymerase sigma factor (sigma-70 family)
MARARYGAALKQIQTLWSVGTVGGLTDGQLLERFTCGTREAAELAFAALVERHGLMVLRVCQSVLRDGHDAEDAFQATFLVLARKAGSIRKHDSLSGWLHGVACRVAACAKAATARRVRHERTKAEAAPTSVDDRDPDDLASVLHQELERLPEKYRAPIVLCYLESLTHEQAAQQLRWPVGTVRSRLARAREQLRGRLMRRGLAPSLGLLEEAIQIGKTARAALPAALANAVSEAAVRCSLGGSVTTGVTSTSVALLAEGAINSMFVAKLKFAVLAAGLIAGGAVWAAQQAGSAPVRGQVRPAGGGGAAGADAQDDAAGEDAAVARELHRLDLELLAEDVQQLRDQVAAALREKLRAEQRRTGAVEDAGAAAKAAKAAESAYEAARAAYLAKARELRNEQRRVAVGRLPAVKRPLVLPASTAIDPARLARIKVRFAPARVVEIAKVRDHSPKTGESEFRELRTGDRVSKGDLLVTLYSIELASKENDLLDSLVQLDLDQKILDKTEQHEDAVPEVQKLAALRAVQADRNAINRALNNLKLWDVPQDELEAIRAEARTFSSGWNSWSKTPEGGWVNRVKQAAPFKADRHAEGESRRGRVTLRAPIDGVIVERNIQSDEMIVDNTVNVFQIADLSRLLVTAQCPASLLPSLQSLDRKHRRWIVRTDRAQTDAALTGLIEEVGYLIDPVQHTAVIKGYVDDPGKQIQPIRPGQYVTVTVELGD